ncbi:MAG: carbamate kinase [Halofilum sp. (in: g-proteobacteria)]|nr:carbamate kinase [Halofilum sp. (in: g-proteobacteria)]
MRIVIALGGNALLRRGEALEADVQRRNIARAAEAIVPLAAEHEIVITHGNGPQVGLLALQSAAYQEVRQYPLDVLGAESEGMIGYMLEQAFGNRLRERDVATLLTCIEVDPDDPAFDHPTKPIGPLYDEDSARALAAERGWSVAPDGDRYRRVVASPRPVRILEIKTIRDALVDAGVLVICAGGGGIPVVTTPSGDLVGVEAVIDKDHAAGLLARQVDADAFLMLTDTDAVYEAWGTPQQRAIAAAPPGALRAQDFPAGSMGPKVTAACDFVEAGGGLAGIGRLEDAAGMVAGTAGTIVRAAEPALRYRV